MKHKPPTQSVRQWESVHRCRGCGHLTNLEEIDLRGISTGIISCPKCNKSDIVRIEIVEVEMQPG